MIQRFRFTLILTAIAVLSLTLETFSQAAPKQGKERQLFNGRNLKGWYTFLKDHGKNNDPLKVFTVKDGMIRISGEEWGCITTTHEYENYTLTVEFKWGTATWGKRVDRARDGGVLIHSTGVDGGYSGVWMHSIEVQIIEGGTGDLLVVGDQSEKFALTSPVAPERQRNTPVYQPGGTPVTIHGGRINWYGRDPHWEDVLGFRGENDIERPTGEWNKLVCVADGDRLSVYLNDVLVNEAMNLKPSRGRIQIQSEGAEIFVRKVAIRD